MRHRQRRRSKAEGPKGGRGVLRSCRYAWPRRVCSAALAPDETALEDIRRGLEVAEALGRADAGQAVVVQQGIVLAIEAAEGTDRMIARAARLRREGPGGVLVKMAKPQQDRRMDLPVIGPDTVEAAAAAGLRGIAVEAGGVLVLDREAAIRSADEKGLFITGAEPGPGVPRRKA